MPVQMFLKLAGIEGESTDAKHKGEMTSSPGAGVCRTPHLLSAAVVVPVA